MHPLQAVVVCVLHCTGLYREQQYNIFISSPGCTEACGDVAGTVKKHQLLYHTIEVLYYKIKNVFYFLCFAFYILLV